MPPYRAPVGIGPSVAERPKCARAHWKEQIVASTIAAADIAESKRRVVLEATGPRSRTLLEGIRADVAGN